MMTAIAAIDEKNGLGKNGELLVKLPIDLQRFKRLTMHGAILMGRKTYESIGHPLPDRENIILTRQQHLDIPGCICINNLAQAFKRPLFVIGGGDIFSLCLPLCETLHLTHIHHTFEASDTFFPAIHPEEWDIVFEEYHPADAKHPYAFSFVDYRRKTKTLSRDDSPPQTP